MAFITPLPATLTTTVRPARTPLQRAAPPRTSHASAPRATMTPMAPTRPRRPSTPSEQPSGEPGAITTAVQFITLQQVAAAANRPVLVLFHAAHCRACRTVYPKFMRLAAEHPHVEFASVKCEDARELSMRLGIHHVPTVQVYRGELGKTDEFKCGVSSLDRLRDVARKVEDAVIEESG